MLSASWQQWQLADSAFPTGAFAHSTGLEAAVQAGDIRDQRGLLAFIETSLDQLAFTALPVIAAVLDGENIDVVDQLWDSHLTNHCTNEASRGLGRTLISSAVTAFGCESLRLLKRRIRHDELCGHQAVCWAATARAIAMDREAALALFTFTTVRDLLSAAVRLNACGPGQAQALLHHLAERAATTCALAKDQDWRQPRQLAPLLDIQQGEHEHLYSRLFRS